MTKFSASHQPLYLKVLVAAVLAELCFFAAKIIHSGSAFSVLLGLCVLALSAATLGRWGQGRSGEHSPRWPKPALGGVLVVAFALGWWR